MQAMKSLSSLQGSQGQSYSLKARIAEIHKVRSLNFQKLQAATSQQQPKVEIQSLVDKQPYGRVYNFSPGPATLPPRLLEEISSEILNYQGSGMGVMEMSHRGKVYDKIHNEAIQDLRKLMGISEDYHVLFMQGGATTQFAAVPLNFTQSKEDKLNYMVTGEWSKKAIVEAKKYGQTVNVLDSDFKSVPDKSTWNVDSTGKYLYYCDNETINGVEFKQVPQVDQILASDMSSNFLSKPVDVSKFGLIYATAQKNVGPAGVTIVIVRKDLVGKQREFCPDTLNYKIQGDNNSLLNTPPCFPIYVCGKVFKMLIQEGGLEAKEKQNIEKAKLLYDFIDNSDGFYKCFVDPAYRSNMNVVFNIPQKPELEKVFPKEAESVGLVELKGHRSTGGMRASLYNAMDIDGVRALIIFMKDFQERYSK